MNHVLIIAEAGVNHNGDITLAKQLVDVAKEAKADAIKFQSFVTERLVTKNAQKAEYQKKHTKQTGCQYEMLKKLELSKEEQKELLSYCKEKHILFLSSPFDEESIELLQELEIPFFKIPSGEITNYPYLQKIASCHKPVIVSTGMATMEEVEQCISVLEENGAGEITLLHCNTEYPTPMYDVNLKAMLTLQERFHKKIGYSDHTVGAETAVAAVALGAVVLEKHITLDKTLEGPDHLASLDPMELKQLVEWIRNVEVALGTGVKAPTRSEEKNRMIVRKSIVAKKTIKKGESFSEENITTKRPEGGLSPMKWKEILGQKANRDFQEDAWIEI